MEVLSCASFTHYPCGKTSDVLVEDTKQQEKRLTVRDIVDKQPMEMANPQDRSYEKDFSGGENEFHRTPSTAIVTPQKRMMTTSNDFQYIHTSSPASSERKGGSSGGGSGNTNPNQPSDASVEKLESPSTYSPFDMWQKYSDQLTPSLRTLEEGKQILQKHFTSFFDGDACSHANCEHPDDVLGEQSPRATPMNPLNEGTESNGSRSQSPKNESPRHSPLSGSAPKAAASQGENVDPQRPLPLSANKQRSPLGPPGTVGGAVGARRSTKPLAPSSAPRQGSPTGNLTSHENIEVNSEHEVKVIEPEPAPSPGLPPSPQKGKKAPVETLEVRTEDAYELERSISELTMRSSYGGGESLANIPDNRRMAYYAVGKNHRQSGRGGNRRCYFSGKLILGGAPFYAGAVQQGLRTLVVFCLPSAINLPDREQMKKMAAKPTRRSSNTASINSSAGGSGPNGILRDNRGATRSIASRSLASRSANKSRRGLRAMLQSQNSMNNTNNDGTNSIASNSRMTSLDDLSLSIDGDLDPNWGMDRDLLLQVLPEADAKLLDAMSSLFPEQFETLPVQVRDADKWRLYVKFCFFSGLPIAEGEMHYKVLDELAEQVYGEEIVLSHDVMEAVNGDVSAEILQLPNQKVFRYLRKHYAQQCSKLDDRVFRRSAWLRVAPEV
eukprot:CAMPEP_0172473728 /NCGR_PEP_ID=MMETSP1065-20121228/69000_1 /TAXON_ID=265537 /ORGANISM="Amphiprora paludosa, Strain CCMP125" /LENGTH=666 /DNA_ID=CAMNT_0013231903 /DNA_START=731 /DNA_END=2731 /DNA_ORIENTATION=+